MLDPGNYGPHYVANLCRSLVERGLEAEVITSQPLFEPVAPAGRYRVHYLFYRFLETWAGRARVFRRWAWLRQTIKALSYPRGLWRVWRLLKDRPPGLLHVQWALVPTLDAVLAGALRRRGWRTVYTVHDLPTAPPGGWKQRQWRRLYRRTDAVILHTEGLARKLQSDFAGSLPRVHVVPMGDLGVFRGAEVGRDAARRELGLDRQGPLLLFFGLIKPYKGLAYLLEAMPAVRREFPDAGLLVAGAPMERFGRYRQQIDRLGIAGGVVLRPGYVPQAEVARYFCAADLVVLPYVRISLSGVLLAALGYGRPAVVTAVGGLPEVVDDGRTGFVVPPESPAALADAICRALRDPVALQAMGVRARCEQQRWYCWEEAAGRTLEVYRSVS